MVGKATDATEANGANKADAVDKAAAVEAEASVTDEAKARVADEAEIDEADKPEEKRQELIAQYREAEGIPPAYRRRLRVMKTRKRIAAPKASQD